MIAISYRRDDSLPIAGRLFDRLQAKFGRRNVFMDFDSIPPGVDFREQIKQTIERSNLVIAVIGPDWLGEQGGVRRIDNPGDFVRLEIAYALKRGIPVIPLLVDETPMPKAETLPPDIEALAFRNALPLDSGIDFHSHTDRLIVGIRGALSGARPPGQTTVSGAGQPAASWSHRRRIIAIWSGFILVCALAIFALWRFSAFRSAASGEREKVMNNDKALAATATPYSNPSPSPQTITPERSKSIPAQVPEAQPSRTSEPLATATPTPESTLESQLLGKWQGPRHLIEYFPDHTFAQTGLKVDGMTWRLDGRVLTRFYPDLGKATPAWYPGAGAFTLTIVSINGNELTTRDDTGIPFVECRLTIDTPDERQGASARAIANTKKIQASLRLTAPTPASSPSVSKSDVNKSASPSPSRGNLTSPSASVIPARKEPIRNAFGMVEGNYKCQYRSSPRSHPYAYRDKSHTVQNATMSDSNYFTVTGTQFALNRQSVLKIPGAGKKPGSDMKYTIRWEGDILRSSSAVYVFKPRSVHMSPKSFQPADYDLAQCRRLLAEATWTLKYSEPTLVQIEDGETWTLEK